MLSVTRYTALATFLVLTFSPLTGSVAIQSAPDQQSVAHRLLTDPVPNPHQEPTVLWFAATGHTLRGAFLDYWTHYGGLPQFGYPVTEEFVEPAGETGKEPMMVQYFERNRFERHPENASTPYEVLLGSLGRDFHDSDPPEAPRQSPDSRYFAPQPATTLMAPSWPTGKPMAGSSYGYPITEAYYEQKNPTNGRSYLVQYFERSRFEYHPENAGTSYEILLGLLGTQLSEKKGYPYGWYPQYGHATDFSWISGVFLPTRLCPDPVCSCLVFRYEASSTSPKSVMPANDWHSVQGWNAALVGHAAIE